MTYIICPRFIGYNEIILERRGFLKLGFGAGVLALNTQVKNSANALSDLLTCNIKINRHHIHVDKHVPSDFRICIIADPHIDGNNKESLKEAISIANREKPNLVLIPGDFLSSDGHKLNEYFDLLKEIKCEVFFTLGNHDYTQHLTKESLIQHLNSRGLNNINNGYKEICIGGDTVELYGTGSYLTGDMQDPNIKPGKRLSILITHEPKGFKLGNHADLCIAGHTHGVNEYILMMANLSQPGNFSELDMRYNNGLYSDGNKHLLTSVGVGRHPHVDLLTSPRAIDIIDFV